MIDLVKKTTSNSFFQGGILITAANFIGGFLNYLFNIFVGRALGPVGYGEIVALFSYLTILTVPIGIMTQLIVIKIGSKKDNIAYTAALINWVILRVKQYWFIAVLVLCTIPFIPQWTNLSPLVGYSLVPIVILAYIVGLYDGILQGLHLFLWASIIGIATIFIKFLGSVVVLYAWQEIGIIILFVILSALVKGIVAQWKLAQLFKNIKHKLPVLTKNISTLLSDKQILLTAISGAAILVLSNADIIYVKKVFSAEDAGIYGSWSLFAKVIMYILGPVLTVGFIFFSSKKNEQYHRLVLLGGIVFLLLSGFISFLGYSFFGESIINLLFGKEYLPILPFIEWASFFGISYTMIYFLNSYFLAKGEKAAYILAVTLPIYIGGLILYGSDLGKVMLVDIWYSFGVLALYLAAFATSSFKNFQRN